ncbi:GntR family transcriptional regulator [Nonomuraea sp. NPDC050404]|uniref:GntR family transcriptional regulator n=1 Tax=Nonomuraea sp. NPDC050404 TaxID=3155783 RepID=UPI0033DB0524
MAGPEHMYERIASVLRDKMIMGELGPGDRLPSQDDLVEQFGVSRMAIRQAMDILENEGLIDRTQRLGAFVRRREPLIRRSALHYLSSPGAPFAEEALAAGRIPRYSHNSYPERASIEVAQRLKISIGDEILRTDYISYGNDEPMMLVHSYEPLAITGGTVIERPEDPGPYIAAGIVARFTAIDMRPTLINEHVRARMPRPSEKDALQLRPGTPVFVITRTAFAGDIPIETADIILDSDRYELDYPIKIEPESTLPTTEGP